MADLNKNYKKIISEIEEGIKDTAERELVKIKVSELAVMFMDTVEKLVESSEKQVRIEKKINNLQKSIKRIEEDLYIMEEDDEEDDEQCECSCCGDKMHDNDYEFEILCPYCNHEFVTGKDADLEEEIECPNCHNIIELDWEEYCDGECNECLNHCYSDEDELSVKEDEDDQNYKHTNSKKEENKKDKNENEDDM